MSEPQIPPEILNDAPPFSDEDLATFFKWADDPLEFNPDTVRDAVGDPAIGAAVEVASVNRVVAWQVNDEADVNWAAAMHARYYDETRRLIGLRATYVQRIMDWFADAVEFPQRAQDLFENLLIPYALNVRAASGGRLKTIPTTAGEITTRAAKAKVVVVDEAALVEWAEHEAPAAVKTAKSILLDPLRDKVDVLEIPTRIVLSCACIVDVAPLDFSWGAFAHDHQVGSLFVCADHVADALIGQWLDVREVAVDKTGQAVPAAAVDPAKVTAKVVVR